MLAILINALCVLGIVVVASLILMVIYAVIIKIRDDHWARNQAKDIAQAMKFEFDKFDD